MNERIYEDKFHALNVMMFYSNTQNSFCTEKNKERLNEIYKEARDSALALGLTTEFFSRFNLPKKITSKRIKKSLAYRSLN